MPAAKMTFHPPLVRLGSALGVSVMLHALLLLGGWRGYGGTGWSPAGSPALPLSATLHAGDPMARVSAPHPPGPDLRSPVDGVETSTASPERKGPGPDHPVALFPPLHYFPARELDVRPQIRTQIEPAYPASASEQAQSAVIRVRILIDASGGVDSVSALERNSTDPFALAAITAFRAARYLPGMRAGVAVPSEIIVEVNFESLKTAEAFQRQRY